MSQSGAKVFKYRRELSNEFFTLYRSLENKFNSNILNKLINLYMETLCSGNTKFLEVLKCTGYGILSKKYRTEDCILVFENEEVRMNDYNVPDLFTKIISQGTIKAIKKI